MFLRSKLDKEIEIYADKMLQAPWQDKAFYANWLSQTYHFVQHNLKLIALAAAYTPPGKYEDYNRYVEHMREESGHEYLASRDLEKLGLNLEDFPELVATKSLYSLQYFNIPREGHESLIGYALCLEMLADKVCLKINEKVIEYYGQSSSFLKVHGEEDEDHIESAFNLIETWTEDQQTIVLRAFYETCNSYENMWQACHSKEERVLSQAA